MPTWNPAWNAGTRKSRSYFDQERAAALGLTVKQVSDQVVGKIRGKVATRFSWRDRKVDVLVRVSEDERQSIAAVRELIINPESEFPVPLSSVAEIRVAEGPAEIRRGNQERLALVQANLAYGDLGSAVAEVESLLAGMKLPYGLKMYIKGQSEEMDASFRSLMFALGLAVILVYLVMASQFESLLHPFVILFSIPLAAVGVALALWLTDTRLSVIVFIGLIMLAGIVVNNAIVLLDLINQLRERGMDRLDGHQGRCETAFAPDHDDHPDHRAGLVADGAGYRPGLRDAHTHGHHRHRRFADLNLADPAGGAGDVLTAGSPSRCERPPQAGGNTATEV